MIASEDLFNLIRSMSQSEKRYFKVFASRHTIGDENDYVKLFDAIDRQKKYDEKLLEIRSGGTTFATNFPVIKAYLYKMILKSMRGYNIDNTTESTINGLIQDATYLYEKLLLKQASKLLDRAKKQAYKFENFTDILKIIKIERGIVNQFTLPTDLSSVYEKLEKEELSILKLLENISQYQNCAHQIYAYLAKKGTVRSTAEQQRLMKSVNTSLLKDEKKALSYTAKKFFYHANALYEKAIADTQKSYSFQKKGIQLFEAYPEQQLADQKSYISFLHNILMSCNELGKSDDFFEYLGKLRQINPGNKLLKVRIFESSYNLELEFFITRKEFAKALKLVNAIIDGLHLYEGKFNKLHEMNMYYQLATLHLYTEDYDKALHWLNTLLNSPHIDIRDNTYAFARIINLILHYELENTDLVPYLLKSTYRYLCKTEQLYQTEKYIIEFIKGALKTSNKFDMKKQLKKLKQNILSIDDPLEKQVLTYFDFVYWIDKKTN